MDEAGAPPDFPLHIPLDWLIRGLVLTSMLLQVLLVVFGGFRYMSSNPYLRSLVWVAYMCADAVAVSAVGTMMNSSTTGTYGIWTPLLLLHLGGPDTITAYSTPDNELWLRHGFNMIYQVVVAAYVMYISKLKGYPLLTAILLYIGGTIKYAERTAALAFASHSQIVSSTDPIYKFMQLEDKIDPEEFNYLVMGEGQLNLVKLEEKLRLGDADKKKLLKGGKGIVTVKNVWEHEGLQATDNYILCLSHALHKMYKRRFVSLYFHEGTLQKTRKFFLSGHLDSEKVFRIVEMELKFMYDVLFTKSSRTAFSRLGLLERLVNIFLLAGASFLIFSGIEDNIFRRGQRTVTYVLISVALAVEIAQLFRIVVSDWTMVSLICSYIEHLRRPSRMRRCSFKVIQKAICLLGNTRKVVGYRYWNNKMYQYYVIDTCCKTSRRWIWSVAGLFQNRLGDFIVPWYIKVYHMSAETVKPDFRQFILESVRKKCCPNDDIATCRERVYGFEEYLFRMKGGEDLRETAKKLEAEEEILTWHIATSLCHRIGYGNGGCNNSQLNEIENEIEKNVRFSRIVSGYCTYLLVSHPNLLPLHADIAKTACMDVHREIVSLLKDSHINDLSLQDLERSGTDMGSVLGHAKELALKLNEIDMEDRWKLLAEYWAGQLIYIAVYNKAPVHAECLTAGGEFLSQVWVLLGHMGCGEQSDSAVSKKREDKSKKEKEEEEMRRRRVEDEERKRKQEEDNKQKREEELERRKLEPLLFSLLLRPNGNPDNISRLGEDYH